MSKALDEIHVIMEQIYEEEKGLSKEERVKKIRAESEKFMAEYNLKPWRTNPKEINYIAA